MILYALIQMCLRFDSEDVYYLRCNLGSNRVNYVYYSNFTLFLFFTKKKMITINSRVLSMLHKFELT